MSKKKSSDEKKLNEWSKSYDGCYGSISTHSQIVDFLKDLFDVNDESEKEGKPRFAGCIWGHSGIGKTETIKSFRNTPVTWRGKKYSGYDVRDVPIAQFEEMGDLHGMPVRCSYMVPPKDSEEEARWVPEEHIHAYEMRKWTIDIEKGVQTRMAPPDWVPQHEGPSILLLDDWNRASIRIIKGIMQLLQNYGMVSWKLPAGCNIVLTGNPDGSDQDYLVTTIDNAILTRIKHITLKEDASEWAIWAEANKLDKRGIGFLLYKPEDMIGRERTNPRTWSEFFKWLKRVKDIQIEKERVVLHANSLLDEESVSTFIVYATRTREMDMISEPEDILSGDESVYKQIEKLMKRDEPRLDVLSVIVERLFARMVQPDCEITDKRIQNFQRFITCDDIPNDLRHSFCRRLAKRRDGECIKWLLGHKKLKALIMDALNKY